MDKNKALNASSESCCQVEAVISVDDRGQMVLPKEVRRRAGIEAGDKLVVARWGIESDVCCITLIKADCLEDGVKHLLDPILP